MQKKKMDPESILKRVKHMVQDGALRQASGFAPDFAKATTDKKAAPDKQDD